MKLTNRHRNLLLPLGLLSLTINSLADVDQVSSVESNDYASSDFRVVGWDTIREHSVLVQSVHASLEAAPLHGEEKVRLVKIQLQPWFATRHPEYSSQEEDEYLIKWRDIQGLALCDMLSSEATSGLFSQNVGAPLCVDDYLSMHHSVFAGSYVPDDSLGIDAFVWNEAGAANIAFLPESYHGALVHIETQHPGSTVPSQRSYKVVYRENLENVSDQGSRSFREQCFVFVLAWSQLSDAENEERLRIGRTQLLGSAKAEESLSDSSDE